MYVETTHGTRACIEQCSEFDNDDFNGFGSNADAPEKRWSKIQVVNIGVVIHAVTYLGRTIFMTVWMPVQQTLIELKQVHWSHRPMNEAVILEAGLLQAADPSPGRPEPEVG